MRTTLLSFLMLAACGGSSASGASVKIHPMYGWSGTAEVLVHTPEGMLVSRAPITASLDVDVADGDTVTVSFMSGGHTDLVSMLGVSPGDAIELDVTPRDPSTVNVYVNLPTVAGGVTWAIRTPTSASNGSYGSPATIDLPADRATVPILAAIEANGNVLEFAGDPAVPASGPIDLGQKALTSQAVTIDATNIAAYSPGVGGLMLVGPDSVGFGLSGLGVPSQIPLGFGDAAELYAYGNAADEVLAGSVIAGAPPDHVTYDLSVPLVPQLSALTIAADHFGWTADGGGSDGVLNAYLSSPIHDTVTWRFVGPPSSASINIPTLPTDYAPNSFDTLDVVVYERSDFASYKGAFLVQPFAAGTTFQQRTAEVSVPPSSHASRAPGSRRSVHGMP